MNRFSIQLAIAAIQVLICGSLALAQSDVLVVDPVDHAPPEFMWQDSAGFLWLDLGAGEVELFDGYQFVPDAHYWPTLEIYRISSSYVDRSGKVWLGAHGLLARSVGFHGRVDTLNHIFPDGRVGVVYVFYQDSADRVWIGSTEGLTRVDPSFAGIKHFSHDPSDPHSIPSNRVYDIATDEAGLIWTATSEGIARLDDPDAGSFTRFLLHDLAESYNENPQGLTGLDPGRMSIVDLLIDASGTIWAVGVIPRRGAYGRLVWGEGHLVRFDELEQTFRRVHIGDGISVRSIAEGPGGTIWAGTSDGLRSINTPEGIISRPILRTTDGELREPTTVDVYIDDKDILWLRGRERLEKIDLQNPTPLFEIYAHDPSRPDGLSPNWVDAILSTNDGTYWIGTGMPDRGQREGGLSLFDRESGMFTHYHYDPNDKSTLSSNGIYAILRTRDGELWVGTQQGLNLFDETTGKVSRYYLDSDSLSDQPPNWNQHAIDRNRIDAISESPSGDLWLGTEAGLVRLDRATFRLVDESGRPSREVLMTARGGYFLAGEGLRKLDKNAGHWEHVWISEEDSMAEQIYWSTTSLIESSGGVVWAATYGRGLLKLDPGSTDMKRFSRANGFPSNRLTCILEDDYGFLWVSSFDGLIRFDPSTDLSVSYLESDGVLGRRFARGACEKATNGDLLFGGESGITIVNPAAARPNPHPPDIAVVSLMVGDSLISPGEQIALPHENNSLQIEYVGLHFARPENLRYEYRLIPLLEEWQSAGERRVASFTNLDPGHYEFEARVRNATVLGRRTAVSRFEILPPWWANWWVRVLFGVGILALVFGAYAMRVTSLRARAEVLRAEVADRTRDLEQERRKTEEQAQRLLELDRAKSRFFANISHEFRTPLALIIGPLQDIRQGLHDHDRDDRNRQLGLVMRNARKLLRLINELLELSRLESGKLDLDLQPGELVGFLVDLKDGFVPAAERSGISLLFESTRPTIHCLFDADKIEKVVSNLLGNAIKFTPAGGKIRIGIEQPDPERADSVLIKIEDTGRGIAPEHLDRIFDRFEQVDSSSHRTYGGAGIGLALAKELVELHEGSIDVESRIGFGTKFTLTFSFPAISDSSASSGSESRIDADTVIEMRDVRTDNTIERNRVLVVEDNADVRAYLKKHLMASYQVVEAENGIEGLNAAKSSPPSLILTDIMMPVMDGYEMIDEIRKDDSISHLPIIMLTARADEGEAAKALRSGADDYLAKPFEADELLARVAGLLERQREMKERFSREVAISGTGLTVSSAEAELIQQVMEVVESHLSDPEFGVGWLADEVALSRRQLERTLVSILDEAPAALIRRIRLERASQLLRSRAGTVAEIAYTVGFSSPAYFTRAFKKAYGQSPSEHARESVSDMPESDF